MRIAVVSPLTESVPPLLYGGTERVVSYLTEELVAQGHDVTLYASGDSVTTAHLEPVVDQSLRLTQRQHDPLLCHCLMLEHVYKRAHEFDVLHFNLDFLHFSCASRLTTPNVTTMHGRLDLVDAPAFAKCFPAIPLVSISNSQRTPLPDANWVGTVYHGVPRSQFAFHPGPGSYLAFLGRIAPEKRPDRAIIIARESGMPLKIAAKVDRVDTQY